MYPREETQKAIALLKRIQPGETLSTKNLSVVEHNSWFTSMQRYYQGESRERTLKYIADIVDVAIANKEDLDDVYNGIDNLRSIYWDIESNKRIDYILSRITAYNQWKYNPPQTLELIKRIPSYGNIQIIYYYTPPITHREIKLSDSELLD